MQHQINTHSGETPCQILNDENSVQKKKKVHSYLIVNPQKMFCPTFGTDLLLMKELLSKAEKNELQRELCLQCFHQTNPLRG